VFGFDVSASVGSRQVLGAVAFDVPRLLPRLLTSSGWVRFGNRDDDLRAAPSGRGVYCEDRWSSELHVCRVFPALGRALMHRALREWPIALGSTALVGTAPEVTFVIPFRGEERLPLLSATVASLRAQSDVAVECVVVEQDSRATATTMPDVRHVHLEDSGPWRKASALNVGVAHARAPVVICHDADILVPRGYAREVLRVLADGFDVAQIGRLLFYVDEAITSRILRERTLTGRETPARVKQNWPGGSIAIRRDTYWDIGGFDDQFVGWGGEDNEFLDRCLGVRFWRYGYLPLVHLWHHDQTSKIDSAARRDAATRLEDTLRRDRRDRVQALRDRGRPIVR
jgi:hypothetical protein